MQPSSTDLWHAINGGWVVQVHGCLLYCQGPLQGGWG
jgi:hypothetical protein